MKIAATTHKGCEKFCAQEIKELIPKAKSIKQEDSIIIFEAETGDALKFCYMSQSAIKVFELLASFKFKTIDDIEAQVKKIEFSSGKFKFEDFTVECRREGSHDFSSQDVRESISALLADITPMRVNLNDGQLIFFLYINGSRCYMGIDLCGFNMSKRQYRIFTHRDAIKATIAYCMLRAANYTGKEILLDPFCGGGTFSIEAALFASGFSVNYYNKDKFAFRKLNILDDYADYNKFLEKIDKKANRQKKLEIYAYDKQFGYVSSSQKNAKIAGVNKLINFSRMDITWLDTKFDKGGVDIIASFPPFATKNSLRDIKKLYKEFFYQADFVLAKKGRIVVAAANSKSRELMEKYAKEHKFKLKDSFKAWQGKMEMDVVAFGR